MLASNPGRSGSKGMSRVLSRPFPMSYNVIFPIGSNFPIGPTKHFF